MSDASGDIFTIRQIKHRCRYLRFSIYIYNLTTMVCADIPNGKVSAHRDLRVV